MLLVVSVACITKKNKADINFLTKVYFAILVCCSDNFFDAQDRFDLIMRTLIKITCILHGNTAKTTYFRQMSTRQLWVYNREASTTFTPHEMVICIFAYSAIPGVTRRIPSQSYGAVLETPAYTFVSLETR